MTSPCAGTSGSSPFGPRLSRRQLSATMRRSLISVAINRFLEGLDADAVHHVDEALRFAVAARDIAFDELFDDVGNLGSGERGADYLAERGPYAGPHFALVAANLYLVPLLSVLVDAEEPDMADVVVTACVHAARDVDVDLTDVVQVVEVVEALLDRLGHRDRLGVREGAKISARAGDDVGEQPDVWRGEAQRTQVAPQAVEVGQLHVGEDQVLLVRDPELAERIAVGEVGDSFHLLRGDVPRRHAGLLERQRDRGVPRLLVRMDVALVPVRERPVRGERGLEGRVCRGQ